ncbi:hypothetical protein OTU49_009517, partial [Cherax quadricarinatus]
MEDLSGSQDPLFTDNTTDNQQVRVNTELQLDDATHTIVQSTVSSSSTTSEEEEEIEEEEEEEEEDIEDFQAKESEFTLSGGCCNSCLRRHNELPNNPTTTDLVKYAFSCPPHGKIGDCLIWIVFGLGFWGCLIAITWELALPGGKLFNLLLLYVMALLAGIMADFIGLPSLLGSLIMGILFSSIPGINTVGHNIDIYYSSVLRNIALTIILIRAGLGLDPVALKKLSCTVLRLALIPCLVETIIMGVLSAFFLDLPWSWSLMLGFIVAAVSPAVVVPSLLKLSEEGYGVDQGIPTLVIAAASIDDVLAITGFSIMLGLTFAKGSLIWTILEGPAGMLLGILCGIVFAILCWFLPYKEKTNRTSYKCIIIFTLSALAIFGSHKVELESSGPILVLTFAFIAGLGWRRLGTEDPDVSASYRFMWEIFQPMLFASIGAEIDIGATDPVTIGWGLLALLIGISFRIATSFIVVMGASFTIWERLFIAIAWFPKATVQ